MDLTKYRDIVLSRFSNAWLKDTNARVSCEGFTKIPGFIVPSIVDNRVNGKNAISTIKVVAIFFLFLKAWHEKKIPYEYKDTIMDVAEVHGFFDSKDPLWGYCSSEKLFENITDLNLFYKNLKKEVVELENWMRNVHSESSPG